MSEFLLIYEVSTLPKGKITGESFHSTQLPNPQSTYLYTKGHTTILTCWENWVVRTTCSCWKNSIAERTLLQVFGPVDHTALWKSPGHRKFVTKLPDLRFTGSSVTFLKLDQTSGWTPPRTGRTSRRQGRRTNGQNDKGKGQNGKRAKERRTKVQK